MNAPVQPVELTNSEYSRWVSCRRKWLWSYGLQLKPRDTGVALWLGDVVHQALAVWFRAMAETGAQPPPAVMRLALRSALGTPKGDASEVEAYLRRTVGQKQAGLPWLGDSSVAEALARWGSPPSGILVAEEARARRAMDEVGAYGTGIARFDEDELAKHLSAVDQICVRYAHEHADDAERWQVLAVEETYREAIRTPRGFPARLKTFVGKLDAVVRDRGDGRLRIVEHKTADDRHLEDAIQRYRVDTQGRAYVMLAEAVHRERPASIVYDFVRKAVPAEPMLVKCSRAHKGLAAPCGRCGTLTGKDPLGEPARAVSTAKGLDTTEERYRAAVLSVGGDPSDPDYQAVLATLPGNRYFYREERFVSRDDTRESAAEVHAVALEVARALATVRRLHPDRSAPTTLDLRGRFPRNGSQCAPRGGFACPFATLCVEDSPEARRNYEERDSYHAEL